MAAHLFNPRSHSMSGRLSVVNVENYDGDKDAHSYQNHSEEDVFTEKRHRQGGAGNNLGYEQEKHCLR